MASKFPSLNYNFGAFSISLNKLNRCISEEIASSTSFITIDSPWFEVNGNILFLITGFKYLRKKNRKRKIITLVI